MLLSRGDGAKVREVANNNKPQWAVQALVHALYQYDARGAVASGWAQRVAEYLVRWRERRLLENRPYSAGAALSYIDQLNYSWAVKHVLAEFLFKKLLSSQPGVDLDQLGREFFARYFPLGLEKHAQEVAQEIQNAAREAILKVGYQVVVRSLGNIGKMEGEYRRYVYERGVSWPWSPRDPGVLIVRRPWESRSRPQIIGEDSGGSYSSGCMGFFRLLSPEERKGMAMTIIVAMDSYGDVRQIRLVPRRLFSIVWEALPSSGRWQVLPSGEVRWVGPRSGRGMSIRVEDIARGDLLLHLLYWHSGENSWEKLLKHHLDIVQSKVR